MARIGEMTRLDSLPQGVPQFYRLAG
jgi:hypothetical protein